jgi:hypothetical protein
MEMRNARIFFAQCIFVLRISLILAACSAATIAQDSRSSLAQRKAPLQSGANSGGMLQPAPSPSGVLRPGLLGNDIEQMSSAQFRALPDSATLRYKGQSLTKSAFVSQRLKELQLQAKSTLPEGALSFEMLKAQFQQKQAAELAEKNARAEPVMQAANSRTKQVESSPAFSALAKESGEIQRRYSGASAAQQVQLKQRALEIHNQLLKMERETSVKND